MQDVSVSVIATLQPIRKRGRGKGEGGSQGSRTGEPAVAVTAARPAVTGVGRMALVVIVPYHSRHP